MYARKIHIYDTEKIVQVQLVLRVEKPKGLKYSVLGERLLKSGENHVCRLINPSIGDPLAGSEPFDFLETRSPGCGTGNRV